MLGMMDYRILNNNEGGYVVAVHDLETNTYFIAMFNGPRATSKKISKELFDQLVAELCEPGENSIQRKEDENGN